MGKAGLGQPRKCGTGRDRRECTLDMAEAVNPTVVNLKGEEHPAGPQDAEDLGEHFILQLPGLQMVENENRNRGRKRFTGKGEARRIATKSRAWAVLVMSVQFPHTIGIVFQGCHTGNRCPESGGGGSVARTEFEDVLAETGARHNPGKELTLGEIAPSRGCT